LAGAAGFLGAAAGFFGAGAAAGFLGAAAAGFWSNLLISDQWSQSQ